ncbi:UNVERIFIED_CONTAM: hypothetical protein Slati_3783500 [Sesamum latifolium]|uniref:Reverse transcriptase zinc-binding domain-containing protein n=1 Tax=Sesamum latifolium TaxID=2727402 RepID=A0AAW2U553_9LAMI
MTISSRHRLEPGPRFAWRSILAAQYLFRAGCRWRVGSGASISVWTDPWIPRPHSFRPITPVPPAWAHLRVADLIDPVCCDWQVDLVKTIFWPDDSASILAIPLSRIGDADRLIWHYSKSGVFSVRSAYHLACALEEKPCTSSRSTEEASWWRRLWQAKIPSKVKLFEWRACLDALPTGIRLSSRIPGFVSVCPFCFDDREDLLHLLAHCSFANPWHFSSSCVLVGRFGGPATARQWKVKLWLLFRFRRLPHKIWNLFSIKLQHPPARLSLEHRRPGWLRHRGLLRSIFDGATFATGPALGIGAVARNESGQCLAWMSLRLDPAGDGEMAEALATREAILLASRRGWGAVVIEGDCTNLIRKLQVHERVFSDVGPIIFDIHCLASSFVSCRFSLVRRSGNSVADSLARSAT